MELESEAGLELQPGTLLRDAGTQAEVMLHLLSQSSWTAKGSEDTLLTVNMPQSSTYFSNLSLPQNSLGTFTPL